MKAIDFLPDRYHNRRVLRQKRWWRLLVLCLFGISLSVTAYRQSRLEHNLRIKVGEIDTAYQQALVAKRSLDDLQLCLNEEEDCARVYAFLKKYWPKTQIVAAMVADIPDTIKLDELQLYEMRGHDVDFQAAALSDEENRERGIQVTLERLTNRASQSNLHIRVDGITTNVHELHDFIKALNRQRLLADCELASLNSVTDSLQKGISRFSIKGCVVGCCEEVDAPAIVGNFVEALPAEIRRRLP
ncbi:MAG: hypothetical protein MK165_17115 [Pirellulaceae bacterium]|nr:hypothetical protein [Pirellulaceae bacterium]